MNEYVKFHLPYFLHSVFLEKWLGVLLLPVEELINMFNEYKVASYYKASHTSQIGSIRAVLNDLFDPILRRIKITNCELKIPLYFYEPLENREVFFYVPPNNKMNYFNNDSVFNNQSDFIVFIPIQLKPNNTTEETKFLDQIKAQVEYYKLYSKNYTLEWF